MRLPIDFQVHVAQLLGEGEPGRAEAECESVLRFPLDNDERAVASAFLAEAKACLGLHDDARDALDEAVRSAPRDPLIRLQVAEVAAYRLGEPDLAEQMALEAAALEEGRFHVAHEAHQLLARVALSRGLPVVAARHLLASADLDAPPAYPFMIRTDVFLLLAERSEMADACRGYFERIRRYLQSAALMYVADDRRFFAVGRSLTDT